MQQEGNGMVKEDCFAYIDGKCNALRFLYCRNEECGFYKKKGAECQSCNVTLQVECIECKIVRKLKA